MNNNLMEIWFDKYLLFPYDFLDYLSDEQWCPFLNSAIYFILKEDKKRIVNYTLQDDGLTITYIDLKSNSTHEITKLRLFDCYIPCEGIDIDISSDSFLAVTINQIGIDFLRYNNPKSFSKYSACTSVKIPLFEIIMASEQDSNVTRNYSLQYIGQSTKIRERLLCHKKIQKIIRDVNIMDPNSELMVLLYHPMSKFYHGSNLTNYKTTVWIGNSRWQNQSHLADKVGDKELLDSTEAMLIQYFNPPYNDNFKNTLPSKTQKTFSKLESNGIDEIIIGLELLLDSGVTMNILSSSLSTNNSKKVLLSCSLNSLSQNKYGDIHTEEVDDWMFDILNC